MATSACPDKNCIAVARHPQPADDKDQASPETFAFIIAPVAPSRGVPYNRAALVLNLRRGSTAAKSFTATLEAALRVLKADGGGKPGNVEVTVKVPESLVRPSAKTMPKRPRTPKKPTVVA